MIECSEVTNDGLHIRSANPTSSFNERGFMAKLDGIDGYLVSDIEQFPAVPYWVVRTATVRGWWRDGKLGATSKVSYAEARRLFAAMPMQALPKPR